MGPLPVPIPPQFHCPTSTISNGIPHGAFHRAALPPPLSIEEQPTIWEIIEEDYQNPCYNSAKSPRPADHDILAIFKQPYGHTGNSIPELTNIAKSFKFSDLFCVKTAAKMVLRFPPTDYLKQQISAFLEKTRASMLAYLFDCCQTDHLLYSIGALASVVQVPNHVEGDIYYHSCVEILKSLDDLMHIEVVQSLCNISMYCIARGSIRAAYLYHAIAFRLAEAINVTNSNPNNQAYAKLDYFLQGLEIHFFLIHGFPRLRPQIPKSAVITFVEPVSFEEKMLKIHSQITKLCFAMDDLGDILFRVARFDSVYGNLPSANGQYNASNRVLESLQLDREFREWYDSLPPWMRMIHRRYGMNYENLNEEGLLDPLPIEAAYLLMLYYYGLFRLHRIKFLTLLNSCPRHEVVGSISFSMMRQSIAGMCTLFEVAMAGNPQLEFFFPFTNQILYEVRFLCLFLID